MLYLLLTYDYELFFNKSYATEKEVLIEPTYDIANVLAKMGVPATFFVDTPSILKYQELGLVKYPQQVAIQIQYLLKNGHDIQLHIHPIWFKVNYLNGKWEFDNNYYSLKAFDNIRDIVLKSKQSLDEMAADNLNYRCCAYRAGGFCYSPELELTNALLDINIKIDSSVCKGIKMDTLAQEFDYTTTPKQDNWSFAADNMLKSTQEKNTLYEIPIGTYGLVPNKWILTHCMPKLIYPPIKGERTPITTAVKKTSVYKGLIQSCKTPVLFTMDTLHANALIRIVQFYERKAINKDIFIAAIAHPKFSSIPCLENTINFVRQVQNNCRNTRFISMKKAATILNL